MAVKFINVERFVLLRKFIEPKNPLLTARIPYFVVLSPERKKTWRPSLKAAGNMRECHELHYGNMTVR